MPKFIYTISLFLFFIVTGLLLILFNLDPFYVLPKIIFTFLVYLFLNLSIPLIQSLINIRKLKKDELNQFYKKTFKENVIFSVLIALLIFNKLQGYIALKTLGLFLILILVLRISYPRLRKSRKKPKY